MSDRSLCVVVRPEPHPRVTKQDRAAPSPRRLAVVDQRRASHSKCFSYAEVRGAIEGLRQPLRDSVVDRKEIRDDRRRAGCEQRLGDTATRASADIPRHAPSAHAFTNAVGARGTYAPLS